MFTDSRRKRTTLKFKKKTLTEQEHKDTVNINSIVDRYVKTRVFDHVKQYEGQYMDMTNQQTLHEAMQVIAEANSMFETVPSEIRFKFNNDVGQFIDFMQNEENRDQMLEMGFTDGHLPPLEEQIDIEEGIASTKMQNAPTEPPTDSLEEPAQTD